MNKLILLIFCANVARIYGDDLILINAKPEDVATLYERAAKCTAEADSPKDSLTLVLHNDYTENEPMKKFIHCLTKNKYIDEDKPMYIRDNVLRFLGDANQSDLLNKNLDKCEAKLASDKDKVDKIFDLVKCFTSQNLKYLFETN